MNYKGFEIKKCPGKDTKSNGMVIYKNGSQYSILHFATTNAAKRIIDTHLGKPKGMREQFSEPIPEPDNLNTVGRPEGEYSNSGYLQLNKNHK